MSGESEPTGASRRDVLKTGALGVGTLAGLAGASTVMTPEAGAATPSAAATGAERYFLKLDGVPGDSNVAGHKGEIQLLAFSWGATNSATSTGAGGGTGKVSFSDFNFTARTSKASPLLMLNTALGKHLKTGLVTGTRTNARGVSQLFIKMVLTDVLVTAYQQSASNDPIDSCSLNFAKIQYSFISPSGATITTGWDILANKPI